MKSENSSTNKSRGEVFLVHTMKEYKGRRGTAPLILNLVLHGGEWLISRPDRFTPGKAPPYPLNRRLAGRQSRSG